MDCIIIEGLKVDTVIGCFRWEREILQPLLLNLTIENDLSKASKSDQLEDTLNYAEICEISSKVIQKAEPKLIENAAYLVLEALFNHYPSIQRIKIEVRKLAIIPQADSVGISLVRERNDFCHSACE